MTTVGEMSLWVALLMAAWAGTVSLLASARGLRPLEASGERAIHAVLGLVLLASVALWTALLSHEFSLAHVARFTSVNLPRIYLLTAFWAGREGSWLFIVLLLACFSFGAVVKNRLDSQPHAIFSGILGIVLALSLVAVCVSLNPFARLSWIPSEGQGLHPQLQSPGMAIHPPILFASYTLTAIPFAWSAVAIVEQRMTRDRMASIQRWMVASWVFATAGVVAGMWWAYREPGMRADWLRYAVENGSLLPWAFSGLFLIANAGQGGRGRFRTWTLTLVFAAFLLSAGASVLMIERIFAISTEVSGTPPPYAAGIVALGIAVAGYLVNARLNDVPEVTSNAPGKEIRRAGFAVTMVAAASILAGLGGAAKSRTTELTLRPAQPATIPDGFGTRWTFASQGTSQYDILNRRVTAIALEVRSSSGRAIVSSELRQHLDSRGARVFEPSREPGISGGWLQDIYLVLNEVSEDGTASVTVSFNPLIRWLWIGGALLVLGGLLVFWPRGSES